MSTTVTENFQIVEMTVKLQVPRDEMEDYIIRLRQGERIVDVPEGFTCKDAFDSYETSDANVAILRAGFSRPRYPR